MGHEVVRHFNGITRRISELPVGSRDALWNYLFLGNPNPDKNIANKYVQFVMDLAVGHPIDESLYLLMVG